MVMKMTMLLHWTLTKILVIILIEYVFQHRCSNTNTEAFKEVILVKHFCFPVCIEKITVDF